MEAILDLYAERYNALRPVICFDEMPYQLVAEKRLPLPLQPGKPVRYDYEYRRMGKCNLFMFFQPQAGWRHVQVTERRTKQDFAHCMKDLVDVHFPEAQVIRVILDNLNTHTPGALYETFAPEEARRILRKLEFHYTPAHASWLNMVEIEFSVLDRQCLDRRLPTITLVCSEIAVWEDRRNQQQAMVDWQFTNTKARTKLDYLYPSIS
jgi:hypothetical protein